MLQQRRNREFLYIDEVVGQQLPTFLIPWQAVPIQPSVVRQTINLRSKGVQTMKFQIFDPAMCCSTGVCGPGVDSELVRIQEALRNVPGEGL